MEKLKIWLKKWLGITDLETTMRSPAMDAILYYARDEVDKSIVKIKDMVYTGIIERQLYVSSYYSCTYILKDEDDDKVYLFEWYSMKENKTKHEIRYNYVVIKDKEADELYKIVEERAKIVKK